MDVSVYQGEIKHIVLRDTSTDTRTGTVRSDLTFNCNTLGDTVKLSKLEDRIVVYEIVVLASLGKYN